MRYGRNHYFNITLPFPPGLCKSDYDNPPEVTLSSWSLFSFINGLITSSSDIIMTNENEYLDDSPKRVVKGLRRNSQKFVV